MVKNFLRNGSRLLTRRQTGILSAAMIIMALVVVSRLLGLVRNRVLAYFFSAETLTVYFAAFRLPEVIFEVLVFGTLSSAFIPTFTAYFSRKKSDQAWYVAVVSMNLALLIFAALALLIFFLARPFYQLITPGFSPEVIDQIAKLTRVLLLAQAFFVISYFLTGVLESLQRFLIPAVAPVFYNLGIILGTIFLSSKWGVYAPTIGAVIGAFLHFIVQLPLAIHLGFRFQAKLDWKHRGVREIGRLALPRIVELSFLQVGKSAELFLASMVSTAAYTYYTFANSLQFLPVGLFGVSLAKASLPILSRHSAKKDFGHFKQTFIASLGEILFLVLPLSVFLAVLRVPLVRLVFGASRFGWESTIQTGYALSAFCLGIFAQSVICLLTRTFYALHDTLTPVKISAGAIFLNICLGALFILVFGWPIWGLALAFSLSALAQMIILFAFLIKRFSVEERQKIADSFLKIVFASLCSGGVMFFLLKVLDRSAWGKKLSFLGHWGLALPTTFEHFVLDTRYTVNLIILTGLVGMIGFLIYLFMAWLLGVREILVFARLLRKIKHLPQIPKQKEIITVSPDD
jgi:putative peptidoglycan lipid II flippase